jgi:hypothetical protein
VGIEDQAPQRRLGIALGRGQSVHDGVEHVLDADALLGRGEHCRFRVEAQVFLDLRLHPFDVGRGQVDLVDDRDDLQIVFHGQIEIGQGLGLHALAGIDEQQGAFAGSQGPGDLVAEIDVARGVDEVEGIFAAVRRLVGQAHRLALDGDAPFPLDVHGIEDLVLEIPFRHDVGGLDEPVGEGRFAVVDMGDDAEISDMFHECPGGRRKGPRFGSGDFPEK